MTSAGVEPQPAGTDVRYVCLSDLHFGAENSILTNLLVDEARADVDTISPVMRDLVRCLSEIVHSNRGGRRPTLILNGDILELALAEDNVAAMVFEQFVSLAFAAEDPVFDDTIIYVPGNHDHHLWEGAREQQYTNYVRRRAPDQHLELPWHTTRMFAELDPEAVESDLLEALIERTRGRQGIRVRAVYPNLALGDSSRCVVIHHGHYLESIYRLMTELKSFAFPSPQWQQPQEIWQIEAENFAWIDFFWSTLGRSGDVGADVGLIYASFQSDTAMKRLANRIAHGIGERIRSPIPLRWLERIAVDILLRRVALRVGKLERSQPTVTLSPPAEAELFNYLEGPVRMQLARELGRMHQELPRDLTFVFGHTHKPFESRVATTSYGGHASILNTGGWVVDTLVPAPLQGGAAVLLSEDLEAVSLRLYQQSETDEPSSVEVHVPDGTAGPFLQRIQALVDPNRSPWRDMSESAARLVKQRHQELRRILALRAGTERGRG